MPVVSIPQPVDTHPIISQPVEKFHQSVMWDPQPVNTASISSSNGWEIGSIGHLNSSTGRYYIQWNRSISTYQLKLKCNWYTLPLRFFNIIHTCWPLNMNQLTYTPIGTHYIPFECKALITHYIIYIYIYIWKATQSI